MACESLDIKIPVADSPVSNYVNKTSALSAAIKLVRHGVSPPFVSAARGPYLATNDSPSEKKSLIYFIKVFTQCNFI